MNRRGPFPWARLGLVAGIVFLYAPLLTMVAYSFNGSRLASVWGGFSFDAYRQLLADEQLRAAAALSFRIALATGAAATLLGTVAGFALARFNGMRGLPLFAGLVTAPMVMPEVVLGFSLLLLFLFVLRVELGVVAIWVGHTTLCIAYVALLVRSRLLAFDRALEEAAMDLGATPVRVFFAITLPLIAPTLVAGFLLSFTVSWDDVVLTSLLAGAGVNTLPTVVFSSVKFGLSPKIYALATVIICLVTVGVLVGNYCLLRAGRASAAARSPADAADGASVGAADPPQVGVAQPSRIRVRAGP